MSLWKNYILALERHGVEHHVVSGTERTQDTRRRKCTAALFSRVLSLLPDVFEKALSAGFIQATDYVEIWQSYLDYLRRRVDFGQGERTRISSHL